MPSAAQTKSRVCTAQVACDGRTLKRSWPLTVTACGPCQKVLEQRAKSAPKKESV